MAKKGKHRKAITNVDEARARIVADPPLIDPPPMTEPNDLAEPGTVVDRATALAGARPAETASATIGSVVGAVFIIAGAFGVVVNAQVVGAITILVGAIAPFVTRWHARRYP